MPSVENRAVSVSQAAMYIKSRLETDAFLRNICINGEISGFTRHRTGHLYFDLKDDSAVLSAVMFAGSVKFLRFAPASGMKVIVTGRVTAYEKGSRYQIIVSSIEPDGIGSLHLAFEQLKKKLADEGLFAAEHKRPLPKIPRSVGVVSSPTGAVIRDILNVSGRRFPFAEIVLYPALVQGERAAEEVSEGIRFFNEKHRCDVIIIARGGGSIEDLWPFNDEGLARTIYASDIPVVSAVGHETDFTIADFAADLRAPTPSAAAEIVFPDTQELKNKFLNVTEKMKSSLFAKSTAYRLRIDSLAECRALKRFECITDDRRIALTASEDRLERSFAYLLSVKKSALVERAAQLDGRSPLAALNRGYAVVTGENGGMIGSVSELSVGMDILLRLKDGSAHAVVKGVENGRKE